MNQRAMDEERVSVILGFQTPFSYSLQARKQRKEEEAKREQEQAAREEEAIQAQIKEDAMRQLLAREEFKARNRANSESTAVPMAGDTMIETFDNEMEANSLKFNTVRLF
jgi:translation initiation factor 2-alpha kinase 4